MCTYLLELETGGTSTVGEGLDAAMVDTATAIEGDLGDAGLDGTLANELTDLLRSLLVRGVGALELGLEGRGRDERQARALLSSMIWA